MFIHIVPPIVPETNFSRIPKMEDENVVQYHHARTINESHSSEPHLATALEKCFLG
jgi:hypothetical protein